MANVNERISARKLICFLVLLGLSIPSTSPACSAFSFSSENGHVIVGRNYDWDFGHGLVIINQRNVRKTSLVRAPLKPAQWVSKFGSLTFNQVGRELPQGGINEKGLIVEVLWLTSTILPPVENQPTVNEAQWIQFQLDNYSSVKEVIDRLDDARIAKAFASVHYFVCDPSGECATIEGINGKMIAHEGANLPVKVLTNDTYESSIQYANQYTDSKTCQNVQSGNKSLDRFARASCLLRTNNESDASLRAFSILDFISQGDYTKWRLVYDLTANTVEIKTHDAPQTKRFSLGAQYLSCKGPTVIIDLNSQLVGDAHAAFKVYDIGDNRRIVEASLKNGFAHLPASVIDAVTNYPQTTVCTED